MRVQTFLILSALAVSHVDAIDLTVGDVCDLIVLGTEAAGPLGNLGPTSPAANPIACVAKTAPDSTTSPTDSS